MKRESLIGQNVIRKDARDKAMGKFEYGMDFHLEGALESVILRSPCPHARITSIDVSAARALEGVRAVMIGRNLPGIYMCSPVEDQPPLAVDIVRYHGEPVAIVAADDLEIAQKAAGLIRVEYDPLPVITDPEEAMRPDAPLLHPKWESYVMEEKFDRHGNICSNVTLRAGDVEQGFAKSDLIVENVFSTQSVHQAHLEQRAATALLEKDGMMTVYTNTQLTYWARDQVSRILGLPVERVRIVPLQLGGGFGAKLFAQIEPLVAVLARETGRAVHMATTLEEELTASLPRHPAKVYLKTGVKKDGTLMAHQCRMIYDTGAYIGSGADVASIALLMLTGPYKMKNAFIDSYAVYTNKTNFGAMRGPGGPQPVFALESHFDIIADRLGIDRLQFRLHNIVDDGDEMASGQVATSVGLREALNKAAREIEWDKPSGPNRGKGLSLSWWTTTIHKSVVGLSLDREGRVVLAVGTQEIGTGAIMGAVPQIVADAMGLGMDNVVVEAKDTSEGYYDWGSQGSRTLFNVGRAAKGACNELIPKIKTAAARALRVDPSVVELYDRYAFVKGRPDARVSFSELARGDATGELSVRYESDPEPPSYKKERIRGSLYPTFNYPSFCCNAAEVEVDPETGQVEILNMVAVHDVGFAINPILITGDIEGGVAQGIGMGLIEELKYHDGFLKTTNWTDYKVPTMADVPDIKALYVEHGVSEGPFGAKGLGEPPAANGPAALANAIAHAIGVRINSLPLTQEKILKAIRGKSA
jgi:CO/xanthine dehydrogenase Mo-binding subunit